MAPPALRFKVHYKHQKKLRKLLKRGTQPVRVVLRATVLLQLAKGVSAPRIARAIPLTAQAIRKIGHRYQEGRLQAALYDKPRPGAEEILDDSQKQRIIAMVCSLPPEGCARWTVRLVAEEAVKRKLAPRVRIPAKAIIIPAGNRSRFLGESDHRSRSVATLVVPL